MVVIIVSGPPPPSKKTNIFDILSEFLERKLSIKSLE
jgi:hypothetical protein